MLYKKNAFTLVELIVVITILAILWTIGFISMQWYAEFAKNSKKITMLQNIDGQINRELIKWFSILNFITSISDSSLGTASGGTLRIAWYEPQENIDMVNSYKAGFINNTNLAIPLDTITDSDFENQYRIGAVTYSWNVRYQLAATTVIGWVQDTLVRWNYVPRYSTTATGVVTNYVKNPYIVSRWINANMIQWEAKVTLNQQTYQELWFRIWDQLRIGSTGSGQTLKVLALTNNIEITLDAPISLSTWQRDIFINNNEVLHLIARRSNSTFPIEVWRISNNDCCVPYNIAFPSLN